MVRVNGPPGDRGDRVLELGRLVEPVGVERDRHVVGVRESEDVVDQLRVGAVILVDLEAAGAGVEEGLEGGVVLRPGGRLEGHVQGPLIEAQQRPFHRPRRFHESGGDQGRDASGQGRWHQGGPDDMNVAVDRTRSGDEAVSRVRLGVWPDRQLDAVGDVGTACPPDSGDAAVLDADVRLDDPDDRVDDDDSDDDLVELGRTGRPLRHSRPDGLGVTPQRLVVRRLAVVGDADPEVRVGQADAVAGGRPVAGEPIGRGEAGHAPPRPPNRTRRTVFDSPGAHRSDEPAGMSRWKPRAASRSNSRRALTRSNG